MTRYTCIICKKYFLKNENYQKHLETHQNSDENEIKYIDLCAGIGGFRVGIENFMNMNPNIKFSCILSADIKEDAIKTYNLNFNENNKKLDIYSIIPKDIPKFDLLCAGFPCQPFSSAGNKQGFNDKRGGMIFKLLDICKEHKPKTVILENVFNLISLENGRYIAEIVRLFEEIGYHVYYKKLNSCNFGLAQSRERVYIICTLQKEISFDDIQYNDDVFLRNIIDTSDKTTNIENGFGEKIIELHRKSSLYGCKIGDKRGGTKNIHSWDVQYHGEITDEEKKLMNMILKERRKKHWAFKKNITWMDGMPLTENDIRTFYDKEELPLMLKNLTNKNYLRLEKCKDIVDGKRVYIDSTEEGYNICKGKLSFPISQILNPDGISPTLTATDSNKIAVIIDNQYIRTLNSLELKRLCGFPDSYLIPDNVDIYDLFGNMATPPVITALLKIIYK